MRLRTGLCWVLLGLRALTSNEARAQQPFPDSLTVVFDGRRGQVEVGGPYAGVEFHDSRPVPSRISFYYPVANSVDLSTDYWRRAESRPLALTVRFNGREEQLGAEAWAYGWTPYGVRFHEREGDYEAAIEYRFAATLPIVVVRLTIWNRTADVAAVGVDTRLATSIRTSHAYTPREPDSTAYVDEGAGFLASFDASDTDSVDVFVTNAGARPAPAHEPGDHAAAFGYQADLAPGDSMVVTQIIGTSRRRETDALRRRAMETWAEQVDAYEGGIREYVRDRGRFEISDPGLRETHGLARALLLADRHYLDGAIVPMPSPAEYNFFFTHDLLLTDLGAVFFDPQRVRDDLRYVQSLVRADSVLPHARYWRDSTYVVEPANSDNWNHLWAVLLAASYLKHSGDTATVDALFPTLQKSMALMLGNERNGLMHAERPDWWDIGHVYGPRAYLTALTIRALDAYSFIALRLGRDEEALPAHAESAARMRRALVDELWDDDAGYLLNGLDSLSVDRHYYSGSLLAGAFGLLDHARRDVLLGTARRQLLDEHLGIRNAMPADFHGLREVYHFLEGEVGAPFLYMNGGVWPQGTAWYALALIQAGQVDEARTVLERYLSVAGVQASPYGQPAFYEYRNADPESPAYGAVDKPTFLWAGGWFLHVLYQLAGVRESPWNLSFSPQLPEGFEDVAYDLAIGGAQARVSYAGAGATFRRILVDGVESNSAVITGPARRVELERGFPVAPYLAAASCIVERVSPSADGGLAVTVRGVVGQQVALEVVGPTGLSSFLVNGQAVAGATIATDTIDGGAVTRVAWRLDSGAAIATIGH